MNRTSWRRILDKYGESAGPGQKFVVILKTAHGHVEGTLMELDEDFLVVGSEDGKGVKGIIALEEVAGLRIP